MGLSRIGKMPVAFKKPVVLEVLEPEREGLGQRLVAKNARQSLQIQLKPCVRAVIKDDLLSLEPQDEQASTRAFHGLYRALAQNAVLGLAQGWTKSLELNGVGYRARLSGKKLELNLGYSHPIVFQVPEGIEVAVEEKNTRVIIKGADKALVGEVAAKIRSFRPPEPYLGKGVRYSDEQIRRKAGKSAGKK